MEKFDVIICGSGSAGLSAALWLARYGIRSKILERRDGPMKMGQADGVQCRTVEIFESFGVSEELLREAYHVLEVNFWADDGTGVMDMIPRTNFPDFRKKSTIRSKAGNILIIPREGDNRNLTRFYIEIGQGTNAKDVTLEDLQTHAKSILQPYDIEFVETVWWSAYSIGQRHADFFHKDYRVFLAGDACHTHSPKAGQGMNVSFQDGYNIGWKLGEVLTGLASPSILETYVLERRKTAIDLIDFDRYFSKLFSSGNTTPAEFQDGFIQSGKYTAGLTAKYDLSPITTSGSHVESKIAVGMRLPSAQVVRYCDSKPLQLMSRLTSDGRWRILIFAGDLSVEENRAKLNTIGSYLTSEDGPVRTYTPPSNDIDSLMELIVVGHGERHDVELEQIPECFYPVTGKNQTRDLHKIYYDDESYNKGHGHAYEFLGIDPKEGALVVVRPDQYVSAVLNLHEYEEIGKFFGGFLISQRGLHCQTSGGIKAVL